MIVYNPSPSLQLLLLALWVLGTAQTQPQAKKLGQISAEMQKDKEAAGGGDREGTTASTTCVMSW